MNKGSLLTFIGYMGLTLTTHQHRAGWLTAHCPFAEWTHSSGIDKNPSFGISIAESGESRYHCFSCDSSGDLTDLILELKARKYQASYKEALILAENELEAIDIDVPDYEDEEEDSHALKVWPESYLQSFVQAHKSPKALTYLAKRNVPMQVVHDLDLRYDTQRSRVCFPIRTWKGHLAGLHGRDVTGNHDLPYLAYKWNSSWNRPVWHGEDLIDPDLPVVLVESVFDRASVYRVYRNVLCSLTCGISADKLHRISALSDVITLYDYGKGGDKARQTLGKAFNGRLINHLVPTEKQGDPGAMSSSALALMLQEYVELDKLLT